MGKNNKQETITAKIKAISEEGYTALKDYFETVEIITLTEPGYYPRCVGAEYQVGILHPEFDDTNKAITIAVLKDDTEGHGYDKSRPLTYHLNDMLTGFVESSFMPLYAKGCMDSSSYVDNNGTAYFGSREEVKQRDNAIRDKNMALQL